MSPPEAYTFVYHSGERRWARKGRQERGIKKRKEKGRGKERHFFSGVQKSKNLEIIAFLFCFVFFNFFVFVVLFLISTTQQNVNTFPLTPTKKKDQGSERVVFRYCPIKANLSLLYHAFYLERGTVYKDVRNVETATCLPYVLNSFTSIKITVSIS